MPRVFVAVGVPHDLAVALTRSLPELAGLRALAPELIHVTLAFVGQVGEEQAAGVVAAGEAAARGRRSFSLRLDRLGRFPEHGPPGTVWAAGPDDGARLAELAAAVRAQLARRRLPFDAKPFRPHVTLARVARDATAAQARAIAEAIRLARIETLELEVGSVGVIESRLSPSGPRYSSRAEVPLARG